jgi:hypothetical protein
MRPCMTSRIILLHLANRVLIIFWVVVELEVLLMVLLFAKILGRILGELEFQIKLELREDDLVQLPFSIPLRFFGHCS